MRKSLMETEMPRGRDLALQVLMDLVDTHVISITDPENFHAPVHKSRAEFERIRNFKLLTHKDIEATIPSFTKEDRYEERQKGLMGREEDNFPSATKEKVIDRLLIPVGGASPDADSEGSLNQADDDEWPLERFYCKPRQQSVF